MDFSEGKLNSYVYTSGFEEDATDFNADASKDIKQGVDTKSRVVQLLGEPTGRCRGCSVLDDYKSRSSEGDEVWSWMYVSPSDGLDATTIKTKSVFVTFNQDGIVTKVENISDA